MGRSICIALVAAVAACVARPASAADLLPRHPTPLAVESLPPAPVGATWSGFYIGGNLGAAFNPDDLSIKDLSEEQDLSLRASRYRANWRRARRLQLADRSLGFGY
jgi:opacity protein-like surface antigen